MSKPWHDINAPGLRQKPKQPESNKPAVGVQSISAGGNHSIILSTAGNLFACGSNNSGQLGDGTLIDRLSPVGITIK